MSLLGSIFGDKKKSDEGTLNSVFESSSKLPDKPQHKALPPRARKKKKEKEEEAAPKKDKKRKRDKEKEDEKEVSEEASTEEPADGEGDIDAAKEEDETKTETKTETTNDEERTIFVGNLPLDTTRKSLAQLFKDVGPIQSTRLRSVAASGVKVAQAGDQSLVKKVCANTNKVDPDAKSCAQGYVVFKSTFSVDKALKLNAVLMAGGRRLRVDRATPTVDSTRSVFIGNLPYHADEATLRQHFCRVGQFAPTEIENVRIVRDRETQQCKGFGYILFTDKTHVMMALQRMHESTYKRREIRVSVCGKRYKGRRGVPTEAQERRKQPKTTDVGALQRIIKKEATGKKRKRGGDSTDPSKKNSNGLSRRQASEAKLEKRHKKLQKRAAKGMGKTKQRK